MFIIHTWYATICALQTNSNYITTARGNVMKQFGDLQPNSMDQLLFIWFWPRATVLTWNLFANTSEASSVIWDAWLAAAVWLLKAMCLVFWGAALGTPRSVLRLQCTMSASDRGKHSSAWRDVRMFPLNAVNFKLHPPCGIIHFIFHRITPFF